ncbi:MAG: cobalamin biosynthesis protein CobQ [Clostridiales bacterium]|jgi:hypothetical protein|nr:cobalamin biosynthesis protein CobQ [Clostridiales bacterium]
MDNTQLRNLSIVAGHYGAGKTNFAVNLAIFAKTVFPGLPVHAADLDIVNPYFRTADAVPLLREHGIDPLIPEFANTNVDIPSLPPRMRGLIGSKNDVTIVDVGGDDGSVALGMYRQAILEAGYSLFYVVNRFRPLIADPEDAVGCMIEIERACGLRCTALVNNSNLGAETTEKDIVDCVEYGRECARRCGIPLFCHVWCPEYAPDTPLFMEKAGYAEEPLFPIVNATKRLF